MKVSDYVSAEPSVADQIMADPSNLILLGILAAVVVGVFVLKGRDKSRVKTMAKL